MQFPNNNFQLVSTHQSQSVLDAGDGGSDWQDFMTSGDHTFRYQQNRGNVYVLEFDKRSDPYHAGKCGAMDFPDSY